MSRLRNENSLKVALNYTDLLPLWRLLKITIGRTRTSFPRFLQGHIFQTKIRDIEWRDRVTLQLVLIIIIKRKRSNELKT